jgi:hypothetical protein
MDGVMNNDAAFERAKDGEPGTFPPKNVFYMTVDPACVMRLKKWVEDNDARVVMSTSWRSGIMDDGGWSNPKTLSQSCNFEIWNALVWGGWSDVETHLIGNTPRIHNKIRGVEIDAWLDAHPLECKENETPVIILDDSNDMTRKQKREWFVHTNEKFGLTDDDVLKMSKLLETQRSVGLTIDKKPKHRRSR